MDDNSGGLAPADPEIRFGNPAEWTHFKERNRKFLDSLANLIDALKTAFLRQVISAEPVDRLVFGLGRQSADDFLEILLLCGNAEGHGARKLLGSMFERVVAVKHLHDHPEDAEAYLEEYWVTQHKRVQAAERVYGAGTVDPEKVRETAENFARVRAAFPQGWTTLNFVDRADRAGLGRFLPAAYYDPLLESHPNVQGLLDRLEATTERGVTFGDRIDRRLSDQVLSTTQLLILEVLKLEAEHFDLAPIAAVLGSLVSECVEAWREADVVTVRSR